MNSRLYQALEIELLNIVWPHQRPKNMYNHKFLCWHSDLWAARILFAFCSVLPFLQLPCEFAKSVFASSPRMVANLFEEEIHDFVGSVTKFAERYFWAAKLGLTCSKSGHLLKFAASSA